MSDCSQHGESNLVKDILAKLDDNSNKFVEFGAGDGIKLSNTYSFWSTGSKTLLIEASDPLFESLLNNTESYDNVTRVKDLVTPDNINDLLAGYEDADCLSIDIDGNDYHVWDAYEGTPKVVIIEINPSFPPHINHISDGKHLGLGSSPLAMLKLAEEKEYKLHTMIGCNLIFIHSSICDSFNGTPLDQAYDYSSLNNIVSDLRGNIYMTRYRPLSYFPDGEQKGYIHPETFAGLWKINITRS